jgi:hypothetical protein
MKLIPEELRRIEAAIKDEDSEEFAKLVTSVAHYTIAFVAIPNTTAQSPWPCGTATLVIVDGSHYFLTAAHVWKKLQEFKQIGVTLVANIDQCFMIQTQHLMATGPRRSSTEQSGPDMVFLKIPVAKLGEIKARKSFYPLEPFVKKPQVDAVCVKFTILLGAPGEAAFLTTPTKLDMTIQGIMANLRPNKFMKGRYDYIDSKEYFGAHGFPKSYGGFSGGGLWHVYVYIDPVTGERKERRHLAGMAFYEFPQKRRYRIIRCHGPRSIDVVKRMLRAEKTKKTPPLTLS